MNAVITVVGKDMVGILAKVSQVCYQANVNIADVTQTVLKDYFAMIMLVEMDRMNTDFEKFRENLERAVPEMKVHVMHQDIFDSMHRI